MEAAKRAYQERDLAAMVKAHDTNMGGGEEETLKGTSDMVRSLVLGGLDGITTSLAVICCGTGAGFGPKVINVMGFGLLFASALSMGVGDALAEQAQMDYVQREWDREAWEMEENPEGEIKEMVELYVARGVPEKDARQILETMARASTDFFVRHMMVLELGLMVPERARTQVEAPPGGATTQAAVTRGAVTLAAFAIFGALPLLAFLSIASLDSGLGPGATVGCCIGATALAAFALGAVSSSVAGHQHRGLSSLLSPRAGRAGAAVALNLAAAGTVAFALGLGLAGAYEGSGGSD